MDLKSFFLGLGMGIMLGGFIVGAIGLIRIK